MTETARRILDRIRRHPGIGRSPLLEALTRRTDRSNGGRTARGLDRALAPLLEAGLVEAVWIGPGPRGGRPHTRYRAAEDRR